MTRILTHLIAMVSSIIFVGACSRVETGSVTHLNNQKNFQESEAALQNSHKVLTQAQQMQLDMENEQKMRDHFAGGFNQAKNADGTSKMETDKRSDFEKKAYGENGNDFLNKKFKTNEFAGKSFKEDGKKFDTSIWKKQGTLADINLNTPEFAKRQSDLRKNNDEFEGKKYADMKGDAKESGKNWDHLSNIKNPEHLMNKDVLDKADNIAKPDVMNMKEAQLKTVEDVRALMGRN